MTLRLNGSSSGYTEIDAPAAAGSNTLTLPTGNGSADQVLKTNGSGALSFASVPLLAITEVDQWYMNADLTSDGDITNLARNNHEGATQIGTGMSVSSGVFTFPSTGKWLVIAKANFTINNSDSVSLNTQVTLNNSSYNSVTSCTDGNNGSGARTGGDSSFYFLDVTDTSLVKVKFVGTSIGSGSQINGNTSQVETGFVFIRLGDT